MPIISSSVPFTMNKNSASCIEHGAEFFLFSLERRPATRHTHIRRPSLCSFACCPSAIGGGRAVHLRRSAWVVRRPVRIPWADRL